MYNMYISAVMEFGKYDIKKAGFKSNESYNEILEHVSYDKGKEYLELIESEFGFIPLDYIIVFLNINDSYGFPNKEGFYSKNFTYMNCSPTSLRYIYHALIILKHYKDTNSTSIVEIGCGYGGLFLAISFFSNLLKIEIQNYHLIDFTDVCILTEKYINANSKWFDKMPSYYFHDCDSNYSSVFDEKLFLISNYCFTEIDHQKRVNYIEHLFPKISNGFIVWQTLFGVGINSVSMINKNILSITEERPQTSSVINPNWFVYF